MRSASAASSGAAERTKPATNSKMRSIARDYRCRSCRSRERMAVNTMHVRAMRDEDIPAGLRLCRAASWNQLAADWELFLAASPDGCRVATNEDGEVVGSAATINYGDSFSWIAMVLVDPSYRRSGIGTRLLMESLKIVGDQTARLDATPAGREVYVPLGFREEYPLQRMTRTKRGPDRFSRSEERRVGKE